MKVVFIKNAIILTVTALILRLAGIIFKIWLSRAVGSEGIGLYQLILSVYVLFSTFAAGGISTAVTRLCADELSLGSGAGAIRVLRKGIFLSLFIAALSLGITYFFADSLAFFMLGDMRAAPAIRILGFSLPFIAISSCLRGYFVARRKTVSQSLSQILEQAARIFIVVFLSGAFASRGLSYACAAIVLGDTAAEALSLGFLYVSYRLDRKKIINRGSRPLSFGIRRILAIATPITTGRYLNSILRTIENIQVPKSLSLYSGSASASLSQFGMIKGMALPLIFFPSSFLGAVGTLLIPEMSEAHSKNEGYKIKYIADKIISLTFVSSFLLAGIFFVLAEPIGLLIYGSYEIAFLLRSLAPLVPLMYIDSICDGMLKGLDKQGFVFRLSVFDSASRIALIALLVPRFGMNGFLGVMYISNLLTGVWRVAEVCKCTKLPFLYEDWLLKPFIFMVLAVLPAAFFAPKVYASPIIAVLVGCGIAVAVYGFLALRYNLISREDISDIFKK